MDAQKLAEELVWRASPAHLAAQLTASPSDRASDPGDDPEWDAEIGSQSYQLYKHTKLLSQKFREAAFGISRRQLWSVGPRYGKSLLASQWGPAWFLELFPHKRVILASYGHDLALHNGRATRNILRTYSNRLVTQLAKDATAADQWLVADRDGALTGGGLKAAGVGGAITGFGMDLGVVDDAFKDWADAQSELQRQKAWEWFQAVFRTRLHRGGSIIVLGTRWHKDDLIGRLLAQDAERVRNGKPAIWEHIRLPTIADGEANGEPDPLGREDGEVLCPELFPELEVMAQREELDSLIFGAMYQQNPTEPEGNILKREWWRRYEGLPDRHELWAWTISADLSFKDTSKSDWVVIQVWARHGPNDHYLIAQHRARLSYTNTKAELLRMRAQWPLVKRWFVEDAANGPAIISELSHDIPGMVAITPRGSKEARVHAVTPLIRNGHVFLPIDGLAYWVQGFIDECADFGPKCSHDDQVDALSQYLNHAEGGPMASQHRLYPYSSNKR